MSPLDCGYGSSWEAAAWAKTNAPNGCAPISSKSDGRRSSGSLLPLRQLTAPPRPVGRIEPFARPNSRPSWVTCGSIFGSFLDAGGSANPTCSRLPRRPRQQPAHHLGGIVDHRDDARVVEPGRADHAEHPDDAAGAVAIGRDDGGGAGQREQLVLRDDEARHALGALRSEE